MFCDQPASNPRTVIHDGDEKNPKEHNATSVAEFR